MRAWLGLAIGGLSLALAAGCGSDDDGGGGGGTGATGGSAGAGATGGSAGAGATGGSGGASGASGGAAGSTSVDPTCKASCEAIDAANCPNDGSVDTCISECSADVAGATTCLTEFKAVGDCISNATLTCNADGEADVLTPCQTQTQAWAVCSACEAAASDDACQTCSKTQCCNERKALYGDSELFDYTDCLAGCTDQACFQACGTQYSSASQRFQDLASCRSTNCATECAP